MLLVDNGEPQLCKDHVLLKERVGANGQLRHAGFDGFQRGLLFFLLQAARQPRNGDPLRFEQRRELAVMLLGENLRRRHEGALITRLDGLQGGQRGHHGLAAAHIALQQALRGMGLRQIGDDLRGAALLGAGQGKGQRPGEGGAQPAGGFQRRCFALLPVAVMQPHGNLLRQQFVELEPPPRRMGAFIQRALQHVRRWIVQEFNRPFEGGQFEFADEFTGERVAQITVGQCLADELAQGGLR